MKIGITSLLSTDWAYCTDQYKVVEPYQGGGSGTVKTEEHFLSAKIIVEKA